MIRRTARVAVATQVRFPVEMVKMSRVFFNPTQKWWRYQQELSGVAAETANRLHIRSCRQETLLNNSIKKVCSRTWMYEYGPAGWNTFPTGVRLKSMNQLPKHTHNVNFKFILLHKRRPWKNVLLFEVRILSLSAVFPVLSIESQSAEYSLRQLDPHRNVLFFISFNWVRQFVVAEGGDEPFWQVQLPDVETCGSYVEPNKCSVCRRACGRSGLNYFSLLRRDARWCWCTTDALCV